jgi:predicted adenylyl cyclase CyaB
VDEVEVKYRLADGAAHDRLRAALAALGARRGAVEHEENRIYADADGRPESAGGVLRLRVLDGGPAGKLTYKGPASYQGGIKSRREIEVSVQDAPATHEILAALGYRVNVIYEKDRETWRLGGAEVALDRLAFGAFCEIEGPAEEITALAKRLGLDDARLEREGYPALTQEWQRQEAEGKREE